MSKDNKEKLLDTVFEQFDEKIRRLKRFFGERSCYESSYARCRPIFNSV